jgi:hypothetical protein
MSSILSDPRSRRPHGLAADRNIDIALTRGINALTCPLTDSERQHIVRDMERARDQHREAVARRRKETL